VAVGRCDGALIVCEAGGRLANLDGPAPDLQARKILASNRKLHRAMRGTITKTRPGADLREAFERRYRSPQLQVPWPGPYRT
jgi:hypothetical protein